MRKRESLTRRERRQFEKLVQAFYEPDAPDPQGPDRPLRSRATEPPADSEQDRHRRRTA